MKNAGNFEILGDKMLNPTFNPLVQPSLTVSYSRRGSLRSTKSARRHDPNGCLSKKRKISTRRKVDRPRAYVPRKPKGVLDFFDYLLENLIAISFISNRASRILFKSREAVEAERQRQRDMSFFDRLIIHPHSIFRWIWDLTMISFLLTILFATPLNIAFYKLNEDEDEEIHKMAETIHNATNITTAMTTATELMATTEPVMTNNDNYTGNYTSPFLTTTAKYTSPYRVPEDLWRTINLTVDCVLLSDIVLNFRSGFVNVVTKTVELDSYTVFKRYGTTYFVIDLVCSLPIDYILQDMEVLPQDLIVYFNVLRILRVSRLNRYLTKLRELVAVRATIWRFILLIFTMYLVCHWNACTQYFVVSVLKFPKESWVVQSGMKGKPPLEIYVHAMFSTLSHIICIGYGHVPPYTTTETFFTFISMLIGAVFYAMLIASLNHLVFQLDTASTKYDERLNEITQFMELHRIPKSFRCKVADYFETKYQQKYFDPHDLLHNINPIIKREIMYEACRHLVDKSSLFHESPKAFVLQICEEMEYEIYLPGDRIVVHGEKGKNMYFIEMGKVAVVLPNGLAIATLADGSHFGEIGLLKGTNCSCDVVAVATTHVYYLTQENFNRIVQIYPDMKDRLWAIVTSRIKHQEAELRPWTSPSAALTPSAALVSNRGITSRISADKLLKQEFPAAKVSSQPERIRSHITGFQMPTIKQQANTFVPVDRAASSYSTKSIESITEIALDATLDAGTKVSALLQQMSDALIDASKERTSSSLLNV